MRSTIFILLLLSLTFSFLSCNTNSETILPGITGGAGEVVIVLDNTNWQGEIGDTLRSILLAEFPALPQPEPSFNPINIPNSAYTKLFKSHRNQIVINISSTFQDAEIVVRQDLHAETQKIISINAPDNKSCLNIIQNQRESIFTLFKEAERDRILKNYKKYEEREISERLRKKHKLSLVLPAGYTLDVDTSNFVWISLETPMISQGILVYYYDYTDTNTFTTSYLIKKRNEFLKKHVPGALPNTYMKTAPIYPPILNEFTHKDRYCAEIRGLWEVENDYMGGPFISFSKVDEKRNRVVTVEGFVYAPKYDKRNYLRQVEAILYTFDILD